MSSSEIDLSYPYVELFFTDGDCIIDREQRRQRNVTLILVLRNDEHLIGASRSEANLITLADHREAMHSHSQDAPSPPRTVMFL